MNSNDHVKEAPASRPMVRAAKVGFGSHQSIPNLNVTYIRIKIVFFQN